MSTNAHDEPVTQLITPTQLRYLHTATPKLSRFLLGLQEGRILGCRCAGCDKVFVPLRATCPTCAVPIEGELTLPDHGTVTTFCIVNIPFEGQLLEPPYACAHVLLDGADIQLFHLVGDCDPAEVRMGLRVRAEWAPEGDRPLSLESIRCFVPTGEPDTPYETYASCL